MDTYNNDGQFLADSIVRDYSGDMIAQEEVISITAGSKAKYGLTTTAYDQLVEDCEESVEMYDHIHHFLTNNADVQRYLF